MAGVPRDLTARAPRAAHRNTAETTARLAGSGRWRTTTFLSGINPEDGVSIRTRSGHIVRTSSLENFVSDSSSFTSPEEPLPTWMTDRSRPAAQPADSTASNAVPWAGGAGELLGSSLRFGFQTFRGNVSPFLVLGLAVAGLSTVLTWVRNAVLPPVGFAFDAQGNVVVTGPSAGATFFVNALGVVVGALVYLWFANAAHRVAANGTRLRASDAFSVPGYAPALGAAVIMLAATTFGAGLLVLPGLVAWFFLCFAPLFAIEGGLGVVGSIKASASLMWKNAGPMLLLQLVIGIATVPVVMVALALLAVAPRGGTFGLVVMTVLVMALMAGFAASAIGAHVHAFRVLRGLPVVTR